MYSVLQRPQLVLMEQQARPVTNGSCFGDQANVHLLPCDQDLTILAPLSGEDRLAILVALPDTLAG